jgi:putative toxin-antitoxin system antitoxin component (TIGR02293 family)
MLGLGAVLAGLPAAARAPSQGDIEAAIEHGLPRQALRRLALALAGADPAAVAIETLVVPKSTLARRGPDGVLTREESEKTERLARLFTQAAAALGSEAEAREFLHRPHPELEGRPPLVAGLTDLGARRVEGILQALEYGLPV